jgi:DNA-binding MurR/RpiR family transcriptional regulator
MAALPVALKRISKYVLENPDLVIHQSVSELGLLTKSGPASIVRLCRVLGYAGLREFKLALAGDLATRQVPAATDRDRTTHDGAGELFEQLIESTQMTRSLLDVGAIERVAAALASARRIDVYGGGVSGLVAQYMTFRLMRIGLPVFAILDPTLGAYVASGLGKDAVGLAFSESGLTPDVVEALRRAKGEGATTVVITQRRDSPITKYADEVLLTAGVESPLTGGKTIIAFTHLIVVELIAAALTLRLGLLDPAAAGKRGRPR